MVIILIVVMVVQCIHIGKLILQSLNYCAGNYSLIKLFQNKPKKQNIHPGI